jgi:energy-coupling factor transport system permease protein
VTVRGVRGAPRGRRSPLHAARAGVAALWCLTLSTLALTFEHPLVLGAVLAAIVGAAAGAGVLRETARATLWASPFAVLIAVVNALVVRDGATVIVRGAHVPVLGRLDVTLEATSFGVLLGARAMAVIACWAVFTAAVDPDDLLRAMRRGSVRSGLTAALATRLMPVLARDARRLADAQRCLPGITPSRLAVLRAVTAGALDRATDVAATLEVRGFALGRRPARAARPWSRHDLAFAASAAALAATGAAVVAAGWAPFEAYPRLQAPVDAGTVVTAVVLAAAALLPFADRRGIG